MLNPFKPKLFFGLLVLVLVVSVADASPRRGRSAVVPPSVGGDHGAGNGGDGLQLSSPAQATEVVVPLPPGVVRPEGTLRMEIEDARYENKERFAQNLYRCHRDLPSGRISGCHKLAFAGFHPDYFGSGPWVRRLSPGIYSLGNDTFSQFVEVEADRETVVTLKKVTIPSVPRHGITVALFHDLSDIRMAAQVRTQMERIQHGYSSAFMQEGARSDCVMEGGMNVLGHRYSCGSGSRPVARDSYRLDLDPSERERFREEFPTCTVRWAYLWADREEREPGQSFWVFPGVYGVLFRDEVTGRNFEQLGIVVE